MDSVSIQTIFVVIFFSLAYTIVIIRKTALQQVDIHDLVMLSSVVIIPSVFVGFPDVAFWFAKFAGVEFPFVVMFGMLIAILFIFVHRLTIKLHRVEKDNRLLIQEICILRQTLEQSPEKKNDQEIY